MLVLSRKVGDSIRIGNDIVIMVSTINPYTVRIGIDAPRDLVILREEVKLRIADDNETGEATEPLTLPA